MHRIRRSLACRTCLNCSSKLQVCCEPLLLSEECDEPDEWTLLLGKGAGVVEAGGAPGFASWGRKAGCGNENGGGSEKGMDGIRPGGGPPCIPASGLPLLVFMLRCGEGLLLWPTDSGWNQIKKYILLLYYYQIRFI